MLSFFKCRRSKEPVSIKPIKSSYSDSAGIISLSAPSGGDTSPISLSRKPRVSFGNTEPVRSSIKKSSIDNKNKKPSVTWDDNEFDDSIDLTNTNSNKSISRILSSRNGIDNDNIREHRDSKEISTSRDRNSLLDHKNSKHINTSRDSDNYDERLYISDGIDSKKNKNSKSSINNNDDVLICGNEVVNKLSKNKVEPMRINSKLDMVKELYNENLSKSMESNNWMSKKSSSKRLDKGVNDCTLIDNSDSYGRERYFNRDKKKFPSIFKKMESHEEYIEQNNGYNKKKSSKKSSFFNSSLINNCFPMYSTVHTRKNDDDCDLNLSSNFMNAKNKMLHREHSGGTGLFNNRLSSFGHDKGYLDGRGPGCASMNTNGIQNTVIRRKSDIHVSKNMAYKSIKSKGDKFCIRSGMIDGNDESSVIYRLSKGISGLQTSTYILPERPFLKRNSLDYNRDSKLYYIKVKAKHEQREREREMKERNGDGYYNENGEFVDIIPPPYLTNDSSCDDVVKKLGFWDKCCPH